MAERGPAEFPRLTQTVRKGGCAAKLEAGTLTEMLADLPRPRHADLLVGADTLDDAAAWRLDDTRALVQTVDFFTPIVDDPYDFGAIAAANAVSDVFAMGAEPTTALTVLAYPQAELPPAVLRALMHGAYEALVAAGATLVGGHSIDDETLKLGFAVSGIVAVDALWTNAGARTGDALLLTKAVGTGTLTGGLKNDEVRYEALGEALASMKAPNRLALPEGLRSAIHAATDVTGFGLLGHALHVANGSHVTVELEAGAVPLLEGARDSLARGVLTRAHASNGRYVASAVEGRDALPESDWWALVDPQTSGGLLLAVDAARAEAVLEVARRDFPRAALVGHVAERGTTALRVRP